MKYLMYFKTVQANALRTLIEVLKDVLNDINIVFDKSGIKIMSMDGSHVALIHMKLEAEKFEEFICPEKMNIGICVSSLYKLMKTVSNSDTIAMYIAEHNSNELAIKIENADKNTSTTFGEIPNFDNRTVNNISNVNSCASWLFAFIASVVIL